MTTLLENNEEDLAVRDVRRSYFTMMCYSIGIVLVSVAVAELFNRFYPLSGTWALALECAGYVCWGTTLGSLGSKILTWGGRTPAELLDQKLAAFFSVLGIFTFTVARALEPAI